MQQASLRSTASARCSQTDRDNGEFRSLFRDTVWVLLTNEAITELQEGPRTRLNVNPAVMTYWVEVPGLIELYHWQWFLRLSS